MNKKQQQKHLLRLGKIKDMRRAKALNQVLSNKIIAKPGYTSMLDYYLIVYEN